MKKRFELKGKTVATRQVTSVKKEPNSKGMTGGGITTLVIAE